MKTIYQLKKQDNGNIISVKIAEFTQNPNARPASIEDMWDMCNNSCWWDCENYMNMTNYKDKGTCKFFPDYVGYCNSDIFVIDDNNDIYVAKSVGWKKVNSKDEAIDYIKNHSMWFR